MSSSLPSLQSRGVVTTEFYTDSFQSHQLWAFDSSLRSPEACTVYHPAFPHCNQEALTLKPSLLGYTLLNTSFHCSQTLACKCQKRGLVIFASVNSKLTGNIGQLKVNSIRYGSLTSQRGSKTVSWKQAWGSYYPAPSCAGYVASAGELLLPVA